MYQRDKAYKTVVSLNNTGCSLLSKGMHVEAVATFKDAIGFLRESFFGDGVQPSDSRFDEALKCAWNRLNKTQPMDCEDDVHLLVLTDSENPYAVYKKIQRNGGVLCCISIDPVDYFDGHDIRRIETESVIMLHNYGTAHVAAALTTNWDAEGRKEILETAQGIFELAQSVAAKLYAEDADDDVALPVLLASFLVTVNLFQLSDGCEKMRYKYKEDLDDLVNVIVEQESILPQQWGVPAAAA